MATQWTAGLTDNTVLPASTLNTIGAAWETWTPAWTGATTNPVLGNGTVSGKYTQINRLIIAQVSYYMGSTTTFGSGIWRFGVPVTAASHTAYANIGYGRCYDASAATTYLVAALWDVFDTTRVWIQSHQTGIFASTAPFTWANTDELHFTIVYEAA